MEISLTTVQQEMLGPLLDKAIEEQAAVETYEANLAAGVVRRDGEYQKTEDSLTELGYSPPDPITSVEKQLDAEGQWTGVVILNE